MYFQAAEAFATTLRSLTMFEDRDVQVRHDDDWHVIFTHNGCTVKIIVSDFWRNPGIPNYFVNVNHANGNFMFNAGTSNVMEAVLNVGRVMEFANHSGDPIQMEDY